MEPARDLEAAVLAPSAIFPTVFDAIRSAQGITPYTDLKKVQVIRKRADGHGGGKITTNLDFLSLITEANESQNIRLFDGDILRIGRSPKVFARSITQSRANKFESAIF